MLPRLAVAILLSIVIMFGLSTSLHAQVIERIPQSALEQVDARAFSILFRQENSYLRIAQAASTPDGPQGRLSRVIPMRLQLDQIDSENLERIARDWERDTKSIRSQFVNAVEKFHSSFPNGKLSAGVETTPPAALYDLRTQMNAVSLLYRDKLQNSMRNNDFERVRENVRKNYGTPHYIDLDSAKLAGVQEVR